VKCVDDILTRAEVSTEEISGAPDKIELQSVKKLMRDHQLLHFRGEIFQV
jgi:hypothetical protein